jgi:hypothetical protein
VALVEEDEEEEGDGLAAEEEGLAGELGPLHHHALLLRASFRKARDVVRLAETNFLPRWCCPHPTTAAAGPPPFSSSSRNTDGKSGGSAGEKDDDGREGGGGEREEEEAQGGTRGGGGGSNNAASQESASGSSSNGTTNCSGGIKVGGDCATDRWQQQREVPKNTACAQTSCKILVTLAEDMQLLVRNITREAKVSQSVSSLFVCQSANGGWLADVSLS